jgi:putative flippase GtrA
MGCWMRSRPREPDVLDRWQVARYGLNGLAATAVHFLALSFNLQVLGLKSAGLANLLAAVAGISASYAGSRYFVFRVFDQPVLHQAARFGMLYAMIATLHGAVLYLWSDIARLDYRGGFLVATAMQVMLSYWGNKRLVFKT